MKPILTTELIKISYWKCAIAEHRHKSESVAAACLEKYEGKLLKQKAGGPAQMKGRDHAQILAQFREGTSKAELARKIGISASRVAQIIYQAERFEKNNEVAIDPLDGLSTRARNCLRGDCLDTREKIRKAFEYGGIKDVPNLGPATINEIWIWLQNSGP